jgi:WD40 repeat protein
MISRSMSPAALAAIALLLSACGTESEEVVFEMQAQSFPNSEWSSPENLAAINSTFNEQAPSLSPDGLSLYFGSNRPPRRGLDRHRPLGVPSELW